ncbi:hypothetical protein QOL99_12675 [Deinococcus sp. MIMF12]|uniref:Uncharacterized protein n=1 Tax=Deinococcus rhizophilus TaxID=3049544 RepID=A0ABT7JIW6_9DEIO|nr:hypothetical protein [Deinococcus rhizophilus]MDL2344998.1 hypothetical protein [Deinococcus rhizophilus]
MPGLLLAMLAFLNVGGLIALVLQVGRGEWVAALGSLAFVVLFDLLGVWLLREARGGRK